MNKELNFQTIAQSFSKAALSYQEHAHMQNAMGRVLLSLLLKENNKLHEQDLNVLEIGCGPGNFTRKVLQELNLNKLILNDISPKMLEQAVNNLLNLNSRVKLQDSLSHAAYSEALSKSIFDNADVSVSSSKDRYTVSYKATAQSESKAIDNANNAHNANNALHTGNILLSKTELSNADTVVSQNIFTNDKANTDTSIQCNLVSPKELISVGLSTREPAESEAKVRENASKELTKTRESIFRVQDRVSNDTHDLSVTHGLANVESTDRVECTDRTYSTESSVAHAGTGSLVEGTDSIAQVNTTDVAVTSALPKSHGLANVESTDRADSTDSTESAIAVIGAGADTVKTGSIVKGRDGRAWVDDREVFKSSYLEHGAMFTQEQSLDIAKTVSLMPLYGDILQLLEAKSIDKVDLVISNAVFQWLPLPQVLAYCSKLTNILAFSSFSYGTFSEFSSLNVKGLDYLSIEQIRSILREFTSDFTLVASTHRQYFDTVGELMHHLKATGVNALGNKPLSASQLRRFMHQYSQHYRDERGVYLTWCPYYVVARF